MSDDEQKHADNRNGWAISCNESVSLEEFEAMSDAEKRDVVSQTCAHACGHALDILPAGSVVTLISAPANAPSEKFVLVGNMPKERIDATMMHYLAGREEGKAVN